jgi:hypothetical protein
MPKVVLEGTVLNVESLRFCTHCKHLAYTPESPAGRGVPVRRGLCEHPDLMLPNLIDGEPDTPCTSAAAERSPTGLCGPEGKNWQQKR